MKAIKSKDVEKILGVLQKASKKNPELGGFNVKTTKNDRGDYGYDQTFSYKGEIFLKESVDGARTNVLWYVTENYEQVLKKIEKEASK